MDLWQNFQIQNVKVPCDSTKCQPCPCPMCHFAHYNPKGKTGKKDIMNNPKISTEGGKMKRELQPTLKQSGMGCGLYLIC